MFLVSLLRDSVKRFFSVGFFHQKAPPGPHRGTMGRFHFLAKIQGDIGQKVGSAVYFTPRNGDSSVYPTPWNGDSAVYLFNVELVPKKVLLYFVLLEPYFKLIKIREIKLL